MAFVFFNDKNTANKNPGKYLFFPGICLNAYDRTIIFLIVFYDKNHDVVAFTCCQAVYIYRPVLLRLSDCIIQLYTVYSL